VESDTRPVVRFQLLDAVSTERSAMGAARALASRQGGCHGAVVQGQFGAEDAGY
jgi:hypothetical protein